MDANWENLAFEAPKTRQGSLLPVVGGYEHRDFYHLHKGCE